MSDFISHLIVAVANTMGGSLFSFTWLCWPAKILRNSRVVQLNHSEVLVEKRLAEGAFGIVYLVEAVHVEEAQHVQKGPKYALKELNCQSDEQYSDALIELDALQRFSRHEYVIDLIDHIKSTESNSDKSKSVVFLFPYCPRGTSWDLLVRSGAASPGNERSPFRQNEIIYIINCIAKALQFIHDHGYSHRDVKPHNILLAEPSHYNDSTLEGLLGKPLLTDLGSVTKARWQVDSKAQALQIEEEAAIKTSAAYRCMVLTLFQV